MIEVLETEAYSAWFRKLKDVQARARIIVRIRRLNLGNFGDVRPIGGGLSELRVHYGPGYRIYLMQRGRTVVILLGGGDKGTQESDIAAAKGLAKQLREQDDG